MDVANVASITFEAYQHLIWNTIAVLDMSETKIAVVHHVLTEGGPSGSRKMTIYVHQLLI